MFRKPAEWLDKSTKAVPSLKYVLAGTGVAAAGSIALGFFAGDTRKAFIATVAMLVFGILVIVFAKAAALGRRETRYAALVMLYTCVLAFVGFVALIFFSMFFGKPLDLRHWISDPDNGKEVSAPSPGPNPRLVTDRRVCAKIRSKYLHVRARLERLTPSCKDLQMPPLVEVTRMDECAAADFAAKRCVVKFDANVRFRPLVRLWLQLLTQTYTVHNPALFARLDRAVADAVAKNKRAYLQLIQGPAGSGKSWLIRAHGGELTEKVNHTRVFTYSRNRKAQIRFVDLRGLYERDLDAPVRSPDLILPTAVVLNKLAGKTQTDEDRETTRKIIRGVLGQFNGSAEAEVLVLDSLDELHPKTRQIVFRELVSYLAKSENRRPSASIFALGRPEAFREFDGRELASIEVPPKLEIRPPRFTRGADLTTRWNNWVLYRLFKKKVDVTKNTTVAQTFELARRSPTVCSSLRHLTTSGFVIKEGRGWFLSNGQIASEEAIQAGLFQELFMRNQASHQRPTAHEKRYVDLFGAFALTFQYQNDREGYFVLDGTRRYDGALARSFLDHSGLIDISPSDSSRYRFFPPWIPLELLRRKNSSEGCSRLPTL